VHVRSRLEGFGAYRSDLTTVTDGGDGSAFWLGQIQLGQIETAVIEASRRAFIVMASLSHRFLAEAYCYQEASLSFGHSVLKVFLGS
jgi:hypothetical protein